MDNSQMKDQCKSTTCKHGPNACLSKEEAEKIKKVLAETLDIDRKKRISIFADLIGEEKAKWLNERLEQDLLLKKQKEGLLNWGNNINTEKKWRQEIIFRISKLKKFLDPKELDNFTEELAKLALGRYPIYWTGSMQILQN